LFVSLVAAMAAYWRRFLTLPAAIVAAALGGIILFAGGWAWAFAAAGSFLITALLSSRQANLEMGEAGLVRTRRNLHQVTANGILLAVLAVMHQFVDGNDAFLVAFLGCTGAVAGDTWATSASLFTGSTPRLLTSGDPVPRGTPGAVTGVGIALSALAGMVASLLYLSAAILIDGESISIEFALVLSCAALTGGLAGALFDSYLGAARQALYADAAGRLTDRAVADDGSSNGYLRGWRWLNNDLVNFSNSVAGAGSALLLWAIVN
jgi:uncharacterized membrane protein